MQPAAEMYTERAAPQGAAGQTELQQAFELMEETRAALSELEALIDASSRVLADLVQDYGSAAKVSLRRLDSIFQRLRVLAAETLQMYGGRLAGLELHLERAIRGPGFESDERECGAPPGA